MSDRNFSRRRRGGMRFRPSGGKGQGQGQGQQRDNRAANEARQDALTDQPSTPSEEVFDARHDKEIERAENVAAGLPPDTRPEDIEGEDVHRGFRQPHLDTPEHVEEEPEDVAAAAEAPEEQEEFKPVPVPDKPQGLLDSIRFAADKVIRRVQHLIRPVKRTHKEVIINAESLETRVAVLEEGKLEEFTIERTTEERLVGSIFKGKVRNLEDGLKAAFVDIGFEKNAFLHYWDIVPSNFDSSVEIVEREGRRRDRPKITQKDIPRV